MNVRFRFFTAILLSFFVHFILMALIPSQIALRQQDGQDVLQVFMRQETSGNGGQKLLSSVGMVSSVTKTQVLKNKPKPIKPLPLPAEINFAQAIAGSGPISGRSPWLGSVKNFQNQTTVAMAQAQAAHQREMQAVAVTAGLSSLSAQLRPLISGTVVCVQQASDEIKPKSGSYPAPIANN